MSALIWKYKTLRKCRDVMLIEIIIQYFLLLSLLFTGYFYWLLLLVTFTGYFFFTYRSDRGTLVPHNPLEEFAVLHNPLLALSQDRGPLTTLFLVQLGVLVLYPLPFLYAQHMMD